MAAAAAAVVGTVPPASPAPAAAAAPLPALTMPVAGQVAGPVAGQIPGAVRYQTQDTSEDEERLLSEVQGSLDRKKALDDKVAQLDVQLKNTQGDLYLAQVQLRSLTIRQQGMESQLQAVKDQMAAAASAIREQAVAAYIGGPDASRFNDIVHANDFGQLAVKQSYLRVISATEADLRLQMERLRDRSSDLLGQLGDAKQRASAEADKVAAQTKQLQSERDSQAAVRYQIGVEISNYDAALAEVVSRKDEFQGQARDLQAQSDAVAQQLQIRQKSSSSSSESSSSASSGSSGSGGKWGDPLSSWTVTSTFGYRVHPISGTTLLHTGVDLAIPSGTPIRAVADGTVVSAGWLGGYGNATIIDHGGGLATLYGHQSAILVSEGEHVTKGQVIGRVGCTGSCTGPHLHYEVRLNGDPIDPMPYL